MKPEETIDFPIRWAWHRIARLYNAEASKYGGSMALGYVLLNVDFDLGTPSTKLGPKMGMEPRSLTRTLKSMEEKGLIYREPGKKDKRLVRIFLTDYGKEMREITKTSVIHLNKVVQAKIGKKNLDAFFDTMSEINSILETEEIFEDEKINS